MRRDEFITTARSMGLNEIQAEYIADRAEGKLIKNICGERTTKSKLNTAALMMLNANNTLHAVSKIYERMLDGQGRVLRCHKG